jgi:hypothetical protein
MIRRLLILAFTLSVFGNSLVAAVLVNDQQCGACCRTARNDRRVSLSRDCCYSECGRPSDSQHTAPKCMLAVERSYKSDALVAADPVALHEPLTLKVNPTAARNVIPSTHIYLRTGTLLI